MLQIEAASSLQIGANVVTNWGSYYKLGQPLLQNRAAITNWGKIYYKLGQVLQIRSIITNCSITTCFQRGFEFFKESSFKKKSVEQSQKKRV